MIDEDVTIMLFFVLLYKLYSRTSDSILQHIYEINETGKGIS